MSNLFQESTGTTPVTADGQPVGLMLDKSRGELLGDELITNGTFDTDSDWTLGAGWAISGGVATSSGAIEYSSMSQPITTFVVGKSYKISFDVTLNSGVVRLFADNFAYSNITASGSYEYILTPSSTAFSPQLQSRAPAFNGSIDNVSIKEVLGNHASQPVSTQRPTYNANPDRLTLDLVDDGLLVTIPTGGWDGYMTIGTDVGTASYGVSLPEGDYELGGDYFPGDTLNQVLFREGDIDATSLERLEQKFVNEGAKASYGDVPDFTNFWRQKNITEFPLIDTSNGTKFFFTWFANALTSFPLIDTSSGTDFRGTWYLNNLTEFPMIDTSNGTAFGYAWMGNSLTSFPLIDTSSGTNFSYAWRDNDLTSFPLIDTSNGTNFEAAWRDNNLTSFPLIDTSKGIDFLWAWRGNNLANFPLLDTSSGTNFVGAWQYNNLTSFPLLDTSSGTNFQDAWAFNSLDSFPLIDTSSGTKFLATWRGNSSLRDFPANMFDNCLAINFVNAFSITNLTQSSIDGILVSIESNGTSNGTFDQSGGFAPSSVGEAAIDAMRSRGWTITVTGGY